MNNISRFTVYNVYLDFTGSPWLFQSCDEEESMSLLQDDLESEASEAKKTAEFIDWPEEEVLQGRLCPENNFWTKDICII